VNRRLTDSARLAAVAMLALIPVVAIAPVRAASLTTVDYELTSASGLPAPSSSTSGPQVVFAVQPPGSIIPPTLSDGTQGSPLTILNTSSGFDQSQLIVALRSIPASGSTGSQQQFGLSFMGQGLQSTANGGKLDFSLSVDPSQAIPTLTTTTPGISVVQLPTPAPAVTNSNTSSSTSSSNSSAPPPRNPPFVGTANVPEPATLGLWSVLAAAAFWRVRSSRDLRAA
jgi:hypothetical protein